MGVSVHGAWATAGGLVLRLAWRHAVRRRLLALVTVLGIACGVGAGTAIQTLYRSVVAAHAETTARFAGRAALQIGNGESGVAEALAAEVASVSGVRRIAASVEGWVAVPGIPGERLYLYGVDLLADQHVRDYGSDAAVVSDPLVFLAAPDSVALTRTFLRAHTLAMHDRVEILTPSGTAVLTIRAVLDAPAGPARALDGRLAVVDLSVAQDLLRLDGRVSQLAVEVDPAADLEAVERAVAARVGARGVVERPKLRSATFARLLANYRHGLFVAAAIAMTVALYFTFNVATIAVAERRRELGLLRAVGASGRVIAAVVATEIGTLATFGTALGVPFGVGLARALAGRFGDGVTALYGDVAFARPILDGSTLAASLALGIGMPLTAVVGPIRDALAVHPLEAGRPRSRGVRIRGLRPVAWLSGFAIGGAAVSTWLLRERLGIAVERAGVIALLGAVLGVALVVPALVRGVTGWMDRLAVRCGGPLALLAGRALHDEARQSALTGAALLVSLAGTIAVAGWIASLDRTLHAAFDTVFADVALVVSAGADPFAADAVGMPAEIADAVATWPDVARVGGVRIARVAYRGSLAAVVARDVRPGPDGARALYIVDGPAGPAAAGLAAGTSAVVNAAFARRFGRGRGDVLELPTPRGLLRLPIAGIYLELAPGDLGTIQLDRALYRRWWGDDTVNVVEVALRRPADRGRVAARLRAAWGDRHRLVVFTIEEMRAAYVAMLGRLTALVSPLLQTAIVSALVGFVSAAATATIARRRTYGVLRAVGASRRQVAGLQALAALGLAVVAVVLGLGVGSVLGWMQVEVLLRGMVGMSVLAAYPWRTAVMDAAAMLVVAGGAGWLLGRQAGGAPTAAWRSE